MANILVCADGFFRSFSPFSLEPYIESFISVLARQGNVVLPCILHDFKGSKCLSKIVNTYSARVEIDKFSPDLIVAFNNAVLPETIKNTKCPILLVASDSPVFWKEMPFFLAHKNRYKIAFFNSDFVAYLVDKLGMSLKDLVLIPYSTDIHAQVNTGFSWRVCDILASNAMLLSYPSADLKTLFQGAIPTFLTAQDLRDKVSYYLKNEKERKEIVAFCQNIIQKKHRYENVFSILQEFLHIPLFHEVPGKVVNMRISDKLQKNI